MYKIYKFYPFSVFIMRVYIFVKTSQGQFTSVKVHQPIELNTSIIKKEPKPNTFSKKLVYLNV